MAAKKPAKPMAGQTRAVAQDPEIYGSLIKFIGSKQSTCTCTQCGRQVVRGMVRIKKEVFFCSATCAKADWQANQQPTVEA
jgi:hypothetical protein